jgi:hypothetical protein
VKENANKQHDSDEDDEDYEADQNEGVEYDSEEENFDA